MDTDDEALARRAGLAQAWRDHRAAVEEAIAGARRLGQAFQRPRDPAAEPLPAFAVPAAPPQPRGSRARGRR